MGLEKKQYVLSQSQLDFYRDNGYLVISGLIGFETLYACKQHFIKICKGLVDKGSMIMMKELSLIKTGATGERLINKVQDILFDEVFMTYTESPRLLDVLTQLIGGDIMAVHSMLINKPPGTGEHPPHQDLHYFPFRPTDKIIAAWTAMEEVRRDNGCLYVVPGSHTPRVLYGHNYPSNPDGAINKAYHGIVNAGAVAPEHRRVYLEMAPGDTVFFHPLLVHGSGPNTSQGFRKAISCHYASSECHYIDTKGTTQENIAQEVESMARRKGFELSFEVYDVNNKNKTYKGCLEELSLTTLKERRDRGDLIEIYKILNGHNNVPTLKDIFSLKKLKVVST